MAKRDAPNNYFSWYNDDDRIAIVVKQSSSDSSKGTSSGEYDTFLDSTVTDGLRLVMHAKYEKLGALTDDLQKDAKLDSVMHSFVLDYVKSRLLEDMGKLSPLSILEQNLKMVYKRSQLANLV